MALPDRTASRSCDCDICTDRYDVAPGHRDASEVNGLDDRIQPSMEIKMQKTNKKIYDLSVPFGRNLPTYAMSLNFYNPPMFATYSNYSSTVFEKVYDRGETMYDTMLAFYAHTGTHLDAPLHCNKSGWAVNE